MSIYCKIIVNSHVKTAKSMTKGACMHSSELLERIRQQDKEALRELVIRYGKPLYQRLYQESGNHETAYEAVKAAFLDLYVTLQKVPCTDALESLLFSAALQHQSSALREEAKQLLETRLPMELSEKPAMIESRTAQPNTVRVQVKQHGPVSQTAEKAECNQPKQVSRTDMRALHACAAGELLRMMEEPVAQKSAEEPLFGGPSPAQTALKKTGASEDPFNRPSKNKRRDGQRSNGRQHRKKKPSRRRGGSNAVTIILLSAFILLLLWIIAGLLIDMGFLPELDLGHAWFNENIAAWF
ncbi:MAG: hypothetical protein MR740_06365 [Clostridium sp.]|nr:hypothetical protein [Clostridium sp.]MDD7139477.1 hypothetical protein [Clostridium sp.]MDY6081207.1 hypothetical protein [Eubacteriales bacterium]